MQTLLGKLFFFAVVTLCFAAYFASPEAFTFEALLKGAVSAAVLSASAFSLEYLFRKNSLLNFNLITLGLFFGFLGAQVVLLFLNALVDSQILSLSPQTVQFISACIYLASAYLGVVLTSKSAEELTVSLPFFRFTAVQQKKKDILIDPAALQDTRLLDLANSGLLDNQVVLPRFAINELQIQADAGDDTQRFKAKKALETLKKLEANSSLQLRYTSKNGQEIHDNYLKLVKIARELDANILTADSSKAHQSEMDGLKVININFLSQVLKPTTTAGEHIQIKVLRYGKEPRQGVGYLDDGTMVVINGGAEFMGQTIKALVLSVKSTPAGRMIFCNTTEETMEVKEDEFAGLRDLESSGSLH